MDPQSSTLEDEDWEVCHDDEFVYKRRKRQDEETTTNETSAEPDPEVEERNRRERKMKILVKLKRKYQKEINHWEILSNNLCALQQKSIQVQSVTEASNTVEICDPLQTSFLDELITMEEARGDVIKDVLNVCEIGEEMCRVEEEERKEILFGLNVWGSPKDLMVSLCYDEI